MSKLAYFALLLWLPVSLAAQTEGAAPLPTAFRGYSLGMNLDSLKDELARDTWFKFRGDRDVSFLPVSTQNLVESEGSGLAGSNYIRRVFFQLKDGAVFIMAFTLNTDVIDHYSVFTAFVSKYGQPVTLNPKEAVWETETTRVTIERPLTVKYIDKAVFDPLVKSAGVERSRASELREAFLDAF